MGFILAWSADKQRSVVFLVNLNSQVLEVNPYHQEPSLMTKMVVTPGGYLITSNLAN